jgi:plasmid stabilization system protein ParE
MRKPVRLLPEARVEFNEATDWYERQRKGLGTTFVARVREAIGRIATDPRRHVAVYLDVRKVLVSRFPYVVLYRDDPDEVLVISIFHTSRDPSIWRSRAQTLS